MKKLLNAVMMAMAIICTGISAKAQYAHYGYRSTFENIGLYASINGGATFVNEQSAPAFGMRLGIDAERFIAEIELSYVSINAFRDNDHERLSTVLMGINLGVKAISSRYGYLAFMLYTGDALQKDWDTYFEHGYGWDYGYGGGYSSYYERRYRGKYYIGFGIQAGVNISPRIQLFGEARYQSIPVDGCGETKWGPVVSGGIKFLF